ncbi:GTP 3',8-cyclase MoaA [Williamsia maris]|uniref:GTP 3',8-cyclase n=1 Tax=Williamsia maris TaxID=72806 RepID=A0ABT1HJG1_9NOCA|nr:GTP 3',8-cyclase MoaA [Williamsia maris]MCP2178063.1 cyclic pyranopterin phosphate synthase [Williamsia maris]
MTTHDVRDTRGRPLRDLRISLTDRCNFRCVYCMPRDEFGPDHAFLPSDRLLTFDEIERVTRIAMQLGVRKVRLTGGEPLLRSGVESLIATLKGLDGLEVAMTTNGALLAARAEGLARAGLDRVTVSLDSTDPEVFRRMSDTRVPVGRVLDGIDAAADTGLGPVKVNVVVRAGVNESSVLALAERFRHSSVTVRFIEYMDVGSTNGWDGEQVVRADQITATIAAAHPLEVLPPRYEGEVARRYQYVDGGGEIGVIGSVTTPFCGDCTRARLSADGQVYSCLFATAGTDLRTLMRSGADDDVVTETLRRLWTRRDDRYSELRSGPGEAPAGKRVEMSFIGG